jgi:integrase
VLQSAVDDRRIVENPAIRLKLELPKRKDKRVLTEAELVALAQSVPERYGAMILFMGTSGLRIGETVALRVKHLDLMRGVVHVRGAAVEVTGRRIEGPTKNRKERTVRIGPEIRDMLAVHLERFGTPKDPESYVFRTGSGGPVAHGNFRHRIFEPATKRAKLVPPPTPHDLRHTAVALAIQAGAHPKAIQEMCGHSSITVSLDVYGSLFPTQQDALAAAVSATVAGALARPGV